MRTTSKAATSKNRSGKVALNRPARWRRLTKGLGLASLATLLWLVAKASFVDPVGAPAGPEVLVASAVEVIHTSDFSPGGTRVQAHPGRDTLSASAPSVHADPAKVLVLSGSVHCGGEPVPAVSLMVVGDGKNSCISDDRGGFRLPKPVPSGSSWIIQASCKRYIATEVKVTARSDLTILIELVRAPTISGTLTDMRDYPVKGYMLQVLDESGRMVAVAVTDAEGRFDLCSRDDQIQGRGMIVEGPTGGHGLLAERPRVPWGTEQLSLRTLESGTLVIRVRSAGDGTPVAAYGICLLHEEYQNLQGWKAQQPVRSVDPNGVAEIRCIPGPVSFIVIPDDPSLQPSVTMAVRIPEGGTMQVDVVLQAATCQRIRVVDRLTGEGLVGALVRVVVDDQGVSAPPTDATLPVISSALGLQMLTWPRSGIMAKAYADGSGIVEIRTNGIAAGSWIECEHGGYQKLRVPLSVQEADQVIRIAMDRGLRVHGRLEPASILRFGPHVRVKYLRAGKEVYGSWVAVDVGSGEFLLETESAGELRVDLAVRMADGVPILAARDIAVLASDEGIAARLLVIDAGPFVPGVAAGSLFVDGRPPSRVRVHRMLDGGAAVPGWVAEATVGGDGSFRVEPMLTGDWLFSAVTDEEAMKGSYLPLFIATGRLEPGQTINVVGSATTASLELIVCTDKGVPLDEGQRVSLSLRRCPERREVAMLGPGGVLRRGGLQAGEGVLVQAVRGAQDKKRGEALVGD